MSDDINAKPYEHFVGLKGFIPWKTMSDDSAAFVAQACKDAARVAELEAAIDFWKKECDCAHNGFSFYRMIVRKIGEPFGAAARTSDDGSIHDDILALKVPGLVDDLRAKFAAAEKVVEAAREAVGQVYSLLQTGNKDGETDEYHVEFLQEMEDILDTALAALDAARKGGAA